MTPRIRVRAGRVRCLTGPQPVLAGGQPVRPARETVAWPEGRMYAHRTP